MLLLMKIIRVLLSMYIFQSSVIYSSKIEVTIGQKHDWAIISPTNQYLICTKKPLAARVIYSHGLTTKQYFDLIEAIGAGKKIAQRLLIYQTYWLYANGNLKRTNSKN